MSYVFVVDIHKQPLSPVHPGETRYLLKTGKAAVLKHYPFTLILKRAVASPQGKPLRIKLDPGSKTTGIALVDDASGTKVGTYVGKVAVRATGSFNITTSKETVQGISHRFCTALQHCDGYRYP